jgi:lipopolysaccharide assembly outer membrane protein LptD (OstA)
MKRFPAAALACGLLISGCAHAGLQKKISAKPAVNAVTASSVSKTAEAAGTTVTAKTKNAEGKGSSSGFRVKKLLIDSDTMTFDRDTSEAVFSGSVTASASSVVIYCSKLVSKNYRDNAVATGNVRAIYREYGVNITCDRLVYSGGLSKIYAYDNVVARKFLPDGNTVNMYCEELVFNAADNTMDAVKSSKRVRVVIKDIVAFSDEVSYNDASRQMHFSGRPIIKKVKSLFLADNIWLNVDDKSINMKDNVWARFYYNDFERTSMEVKVETDKNAASGKTLQ